MGRNIFLDFSNILKCGQNSAQCSYVSSTWLNNPKSYSPRPLQLSCGTSFPLSLSHRNHIVSSTDASVSIPKRHRVPIFLLFCFYESIFGLQCCVSFRNTAKLDIYIYIYIYIFFFRFFSLITNIEHSSLCCTVGPC